MKKPAILAAIALSLAATLGPITTAEAAPAPKVSTVVSAPTTGESLAAAGVSAVGSNRAASGACDLALNGPAKAVVLCGSHYVELVWPDGRLEYVVLGSDRQIWNSYQYSVGGSWSTWGLLGNSNNVQDITGGWFSGGNPTVQALGGNGGYWCNTYTGNGAWTNWYAC
ncbi:MULTISPECIES: hypothetical protein [unclassified Streptomyces]|uniref:hypothetical protein n=1 Tax=unclassified Streptomyces TaxID=2593676 RepID=UPI003820EC73